MYKMKMLTIRGSSASVWQTEDLLELLSANRDTDLDLEQTTL